MAAPAAEARKSIWPAVLEVLLFLCILGQLAYLAAFPLFVWGLQVSRSGALFLTFVRLGAYAGLLWGLQRGSRLAACGVIVELARTFIVFALAARLQEQTLFGVLYPAAWTHGLLSAALPVLVLLNTAVEWGWRPHHSMVDGARVGAQILAGTCAWSAYWLAREPQLLLPARAEKLPKPLEVVVQGLPVAALLTAAEALALRLP